MKRRTFGILALMCAALSYAGFCSAAEHPESTVANIVLALVFAFLTFLCIRKTIHPNGKPRPESRTYSQGTPLPVVNSGTLLLSRGEVCHINESAKSGKFKTVTAGYTGGHAGASVRIAKGLTIRTASYRGTPIKKKALDTCAGRFYVTNKRIVMISQKYGFDKPLSSVSGFEMYSDGFSLQVGSAYYTILVNEPVYVMNVLIGAAKA